MSIEDVKALTFDTGGTILDWHTGFSNALTKAGAKYGLEKDWVPSPMNYAAGRCAA